VATISARRDAAAGYAFFGSGDGYTPPQDVRELIKEAHGQFSDTTKAWRVPIDKSGALLVAIRAEGHTVVVNEGERTTATRHHRPLWCSQCSVAVRFTGATECPRCSGPLECDGGCAAAIPPIPDCRFAVDRSPA
jgi:hypothetical protein